MEHLPGSDAGLSFPSLPSLEPQDLEDVRQLFVLVANARARRSRAPDTREPASCPRAGQPVQQRIELFRLLRHLVPAVMPSPPGCPAPRRRRGEAAPRRPTCTPPPRSRTDTADRPTGRDRGACRVRRREIVAVHLVHQGEVLRLARNTVSLVTVLYVPPASASARPRLSIARRISCSRSPARGASADAGPDLARRIDERAADTSGAQRHGKRQRALCWIHESPSEVGGCKVCLSRRGT
jgi:hypothetical protein